MDSLRKVNDEGDLLSVDHCGPKIIPGGHHLYHGGFCVYPHQQHQHGRSARPHHHQKCPQEAAGTSVRLYLSVCCHAIGGSPQYFSHTV